MSLYIQPGLRDRDPANPDDDPIGDEMREVGLTRDDVGEKAFLAARQMLLEGRIDLDEVATTARRLDAAR
jgi:hypothetical protein